MPSATPRRSRRDTRGGARAAPAQGGGARRCERERRRGRRGRYSTPTCPASPPSPSPPPVARAAGVVDPLARWRAGKPSRRRRRVRLVLTPRVHLRRMPPTLCRQQRHQRRAGAAAPSRRGGTALCAVATWSLFMCAVVCAYGSCTGVAQPGRRRRWRSRHALGGSCTCPRCRTAAPRGWPAAAQPPVTLARDGLGLGWAVLLEHAARRARPRS